MMEPITVGLMRADRVREGDYLDDGNGRWVQVIMADQVERQYRSIVVRDIVIVLKFGAFESFHEPGMLLLVGRRNDHGQ
jgi:hypothetical protein